jgi:hypothetical protein
VADTGVGYGGDLFGPDRDIRGWPTQWSATTAYFLDFFFKIGQRVADTVVGHYGIFPGFLL